jgi:hypothetical protein
MKKAVFVCIGIVMLVFIGCGFFGKGATPEEVAEKYIGTKFEKIGCDLSGLKYTVDEKEDKATVKISGNIKYEKKIDLVKKDGEWKIAVMAVKANKAPPEAKLEAPEAKQEEPEAKKEEPKAEKEQPKETNHNKAKH